MRSEDTEHRSIWPEDDGWSVGIIDQTRLPEAFEASRLATLEETAAAISGMKVRGPPLIGVTAAYGMALALRRDPGDEAQDTARRTLLATPPTAVNRGAEPGRGDPCRRPELIQSGAIRVQEGSRGGTSRAQTGLVPTGCYPSTPVPPAP